MYRAGLRLIPGHSTPTRKVYLITGSNVDFSQAGAGGGIVNNASAGQFIAIFNNIGESVAGVQVQQSGASTLVLAGTNTYTGGTLISSGTVQVRNNSSVGLGAVTLDGGTFQTDGTSPLTFTNAFNVNTTGGTIDNFGSFLTLQGTIADGNGITGVLQFTDTSFSGGTTVLSGANTYSGGTLISGGTVQVTSVSSVGTGAVTLNGGRFQLDGAGDLTFTNAFRLDTGGGVLDSNGRFLTIGGIISDGNGPGLLQITDTAGGGVTILSGANTYTGGTLVSGTMLQVNNNASVGTGTVTLDNAIFQTDNTIDLTFTNNFQINITAGGGTLDANGKVLTIAGNISDGNGPGQLRVADTFGGGRLVLLGNNTYSGGTEICFCSTLQLGNSTHIASLVGAVSNFGTLDIVNANTAGITSITNDGGFVIFRNANSAGSMTIDNLSGSGASIEFRQTASAGNATINNFDGTSTTFFNNATAGNATINNIAGFGSGVIEFNNLSRAGTATINNAGNGFVVFNDRTTLENGKLVNADGGLVLFNSQSSAGTSLASITNKDLGQVHFLDRSSAGGATIINSDFAVLDFNNRTTAANATIVNSSFFGMAFLDQSTAGNAFITTSNNSTTFFFNRSDGGTARFETEAGSVVDFSGSRGPNNDKIINAGSIGGAGTYIIGDGRTLVVGGNNLSSEVSGVIADTCGCTPGSGSLVKVGTGNLTLSGVNTYTGTTSVNGGKLTVNGSIVSSAVHGQFRRYAQRQRLGGQCHRQCRRHPRRQRHRRQHDDQRRRAGARQFGRPAHGAGQPRVHGGGHLHGRNIARRCRPHQCDRDRDARRRHRQRDLRGPGPTSPSNTPSSMPPAASAAPFEPLVNTNCRRISNPA